MKKMLLIITLCVNAALVNAQTQTETQEWLNTKKADFVNSDTRPAYFSGVTLGKKIYND